MDFHKIEIEDDLEEYSEDELRELVSEFAKAQEANIKQFEDVTDRVAELEEYDDELTEELVNNSPLAEAEAKNVSFSRKRELIEEFAQDEQSEQSEEAGGDEGDETFGKRGKTHDDSEDDTEEFIKEKFEDIPGVQP